MRILIILNANVGQQAGAVHEYAGLLEAYYLFSDAGMDVVLAAPGGGSASESTGTGSNRDGAAAALALRRFDADRQARDVMNDLVDLTYVCAEDFDAALSLGPHRLNGSVDVKDRTGLLVDQLLAAAKPVAVIGSAPTYAPAEAGNGLLIIGNSTEAPRLAANALLGAIGVR
jgi:putative intracellular protease/amidase